MNKETKNKSDFNFAKYSKERDAFWRSKYPTSRTLFRILEVLNIISLIILFIGAVYILSEVYFAQLQTLIIFLIVVGFSIVSFLLFREIILFQVDRNFFEYKQTEKLLKKE